MNTLTRFNRLIHKMVVFGAACLIMLSASSSALAQEDSPQLIAHSEMEMHIPLADQVPTDAILYFGWAGTDEMSEAYGESKLRAFLEASKLIEKWRGPINQIMVRLEMEAQHDREAQFALEAIKELLPTALQRPWAFYIDHVELMPEGEEPIVSATLKIDPGPDMGDQIEQVLSKYVGLLNDENPDLPVSLLEDDYYVGIVISNIENPEAKEMGLILPEGTRPVENPLMVTHVDTAKIYTLVMQGIDMYKGDDPDTPKVLAVLEVLKLDEIKSLTALVGFDEGEWVESAFLASPGPREGVLTLVENDPIDEQAMTLVPATASWARVLHFDTAKVMPMVRKVVAAAEPEALEEMEEGLAEFREETGLDLEENIINALGKTWVIYSEPTFPSMFGPGLCFINVPNDPEALDQTLQVLAQFINAQANRGNAMFRITELDLQEIKVSTIGLPFMTLAWGLHEGRFYFATSPDAVLKAHQTANDPESSLANSEKFQAVYERLGQHPSISLMYTDLEKSAPQMYPLYAMLMNFAAGPVLNETGINLMGIIPTLGEILPHLEPAGSAFWYDENGFYSYKVEPFPGSLLLSPEAGSMAIGGPAGFPIMIGTTLPALGAARRSARMSQSSSNIRQITIASLAYAADNNDMGPESFSQLMPYLGNHTDPFFSPFDKHRPAMNFDADGQLEEGWLTKNADYVLIPTETFSEHERSWEVILIFQKPHDNNPRNYVPVGYVDGHVAVEDVDVLAAQIKEQTGFTMEQWIEAAKEGTMPANLDIHLSVPQ